MIKLLLFIIFFPTAVLLSIFLGGLLFGLVLRWLGGIK